ncbi:AAA family ATPase [Candidatus Pacearchaeota archaeon]|nr:AAA family ATPase [Candidatus Pacearchaeota archaeon]
MRLKKIVLNNIRSYENQEVEFSEGSTLLSGDIGSGKTSILLGIEFALFGLQPGQRGSALLKNGKDTGGVKIEFVVDDKEVIVERTLKKGSKTISQDYCSIRINGEKRELSVTELKNSILDLLSYPGEFSKKQNILYKFTVYTPQEEMKQIILQDPVTRTNTLRHIFGIDKYKRILENISIVTSKLREERRLKEGLTETIEQDRMNILSKENELEAKHYNLVSVEKELFSKEEKRKKVQEEKEEISKKIEEKNKFQQEIEKTKIMVLNKKESLSNNLEITKQIEGQIKELSELRFDELEIERLASEIALRKKEKEEFNQKSIEISTRIYSLDLKNKENEKIKEKLTHIEVCPTCMQDVGPTYKANVVNKLSSNTSENIKHAESLNLAKQKLFESMTEIDSKISMAEKRIQELNILKIKLQGIEEKQGRLKEIEISNKLLENDVELLNNQMGTLRDSVFEFAKFDNLFESKQKELNNALNDERLAEIKVAELKKEIEVFSTQVEELKERIKKTEEIKKQLDYIIELENWLSKKFAPVISLIEKNVMVNLKVEFSKLFEEWFSMLVSESFNISISDDFTPIIEQQDYEIDYTYLSGGERTAVALAYRLALNQVINSMLSKIKTRDFVILDEPTDGFSDQQLDKMREVLDQLNVAQLIIVSHEQKIEGFVENVIRIKKENGRSFVEA